MSRKAIFLSISKGAVVSDHLLQPHYLREEKRKCILLYIYVYIDFITKIDVTIKIVSKTNVFITAGCHTF